MTTPRYTHGHDESVLRSHAWRTVENSAAYLQKHLTPGSSLLDVGCGPGTITVDFARRLAPGRVVGIDPSAEVLQGARATADAAGVAVDFIEASIGDDPSVWAPDGERFDIVHAHQVLQHLPDPVAALRDMRAACAPGGLVAARDSDYAGFFWYPRLPELDEWLALYRTVARISGGEPDAARHLKAWARAAGFTEFSVIPDIWCFPTGPERQWWGSLWADRIRRSTVAETALSEGLATAADLERIAAGWLEWAAGTDALLVIPHLALLARNTAE